MGTQPPFDERGSTAAVAPSVSVEVEGHGIGASVSNGPIVEPRNRVRPATLAGAVFAVFVLLGLLLVVVSTGSVEPEPEQASTSPAVTQVPVVVQPTVTVPLIDQLPTTDASHVDGLVLAWVDADSQLRVRELLTGEDVVVSRLARTNLPPLPDHIHLLGATNSTWLIDLLEPENSGELSNTVRMVRLGEDVDSYAFISTNDGADTEFFVGSLWGPAATGTAAAPASAAVLTVPQRGVIVATRAAQSSVLFGDGLERLPTRLGRIVAASKTFVVGIFCDDLGRCIGRVANWDGSNEIEIRADALGAPVVRISPDERFIVTAGGASWTVYDLLDGSVTRWTSGLLPNETMSWAPDSTGVFWVDGGVVVHQALDEGGRGALSSVRQLGGLGQRLPASDVVVLENP